MNSEGDTAGILLPLLLLGAVAFAVICIIWGLNSGTAVQLGSFEKNDCSEKLSLFAQEYGGQKQVDNFFLNANDIYLIDFNDFWIVPLDGRTCKIVEVEDFSKELFRTSFVKKQLADFGNDFFISTRDCINIAAYKGASNVCEATGLSNSILNFPVTEIVATIPTEGSKAFAEKLTGSEWVAASVGSGAKVIKKIKGSNITVALDFVENTSCSMKNTPKKAIWDLADAANQIFLKAKNNEFYSDTFPKLSAASEYIITLEPLKVELQLPKYETPNGIIDSLLLIPRAIFDALTLVFRTMADTTIETINIVATPECSAEKQITKFIDFQTKINQTDYLVDFEKFNTTLTQLKSGATAAMERERQIKNENWPNLLTFIIAPSKCGLYFFESSDAQKYFDQQLYITSKKVAEAKQSYYQNYWKEISVVHYVITTILYLLILVSLFFIYKSIKKGGNSNYGGGAIV